MSDKLNDTEKAALSTILRKPVMKKAVALSQERTQQGLSTIEAAALNQAYNQGREDAMSTLFELCDQRAPNTVHPRQLKNLGGQTQR